MNPDFSASTVLGIGIAVMLLLSGGTISTTGESTNQTSNISKESIATSMLYRELIPENQLLTQEDSNVTQGIAKTVTPKYKVKVTFDSIIIHHPLELVFPFSETDFVEGEFDLSVYVQGKRIWLSGDGTGPTTEKCSHPKGDLPDCGLWNAENGETITFDPGTEVTVEMPQDVPLSIFNAGLEIDSCGRVNWPKDDDPKLIELISLLNDPNGRAFSPLKIKAFQNYIIHNNDDCFGDDNGPISSDQTFYEPTKYGAGSHFDTAGDYTLRYTISVTPPLISERLKGDIPLLTLEQCNNNLPVSSFNSSGNQPTYLPAYAIDNNLNTKWWSTLIVNPFITLDLGAPKYICGADIAWSDGNLHTYKFDISVSTDGTSFTKVFSGTSSGTASSPEKYSIPLTQGRYVKITITESTPGSTRSIAEISETNIFS